MMYPGSEADLLSRAWPAQQRLRAGCSQVWPQACPIVMRYTFVYDTLIHCGPKMQLMGVPYTALLTRTWVSRLLGLLGPFQQLCCSPSCASSLMMLTSLTAVPVPDEQTRARVIPYPTVHHSGSLRAHHSISQGPLLCSGDGFEHGVTLRAMEWRLVRLDSSASTAWVVLQGSGSCSLRPASAPSGGGSCAGPQACRWRSRVIATRTGPLKLLVSHHLLSAAPSTLL